MRLSITFSLLPVMCACGGPELEDARHRAVMIAERDDIEAKVDRVQSWMLDLQQASSCEERKVTIELLAQRSDRRAIGVLKRARAMKCVEQDAASAAEGAARGGAAPAAGRGGVRRRWSR